MRTSPAKFESALRIALATLWAEISCTQAWNMVDVRSLTSRKNSVRSFKLSKLTLSPGAESSEFVVRMLEIARL